MPNKKAYETITSAIDLSGIYIDGTAYIPVIDRNNHP
jgi:hypothetical protein